jgi:exopolyphosphatase/guanosine-5'-triphosphate,3'-diphosphate pyrophosphatase
MCYNIVEMTLRGHSRCGGRQQQRKGMGGMEHSGTPMGRRHRAPKLPTFAAIDVGTHNCRMLIAHARPPKHFRIIEAFSRSVRLGEGLESAGRLSEAAMARALAALTLCAHRMHAQGVVRARAVATEACRRAENGVEFLDRVAAETGIVLEPISPQEEAELTLAGCLGLLDPAFEHALLFDIGGGSTEIVWVRQRPPLPPRLEALKSLPVGVVTFAERFGLQTINAATYERMVAYVDHLLEPFAEADAIAAAVARGEVQMLGTSGTVTTLAAVHLGLRRYERARVDGLVISVDDIVRVSSRLVVSDLAARIATPCIGRERADLVVAGCAILEAICRKFPVGRLTVADRGIREGLLTAMVGAMPAEVALVAAPPARHVSVVDDHQKNARPRRARSANGRR